MRKRISLAFDERFIVKFEKARSEIQRLEAKALQIDGRILARHRYSDGDLLASPHLRRCETICRKIAHDVQQWESVGKFTDCERQAYLRERHSSGPR